VRSLRLLLSSLLMLSHIAYAAETPMFTQSQQLKDGLVAMRSGDKAKAWDLLFPQAQAGDIQAMFYLGEMMLRSPEYSDNLERATKFFAVAAAKGHAGAKEMLPRVRAMLEEKTKGTLPSIAGTSGTPSQAEIDRVNAQLTKYKAEVLRYTDALADSASVPRIDVMVFLAKTDAAAEKIYSMTQGLENQFGTKIKTNFYVVINPAEWKPDNQLIGGTSLPPKGFTPDFKGQLAASHGVRHLPAVVVIPPSGQAKVIEDLSSISTVISSLL
jgi:hypothetical protein